MDFFSLKLLLYFPLTSLLAFKESDSDYQVFVTYNFLKQESADKINACVCVGVCMCARACKCCIPSTPVTLHVLTVDTGRVCAAADNKDLYKSAESRRSAADL